MLIEGVYTKREFENYPSYDIVYEWEDIYKDVLMVDYIPKNKYLEYLEDKRFESLNVLLRIISTRKNVFALEMTPYANNINNKKNYIPCIIDFYLRTDKELLSFYNNYYHCPIVLISSKEAYDYLKSKGCPLNIAHHPLSISDKYSITSDSKIEKKYDLVMVGRQNPKLETFVKMYYEKHPDFYFVYRKSMSDKTWIYATSRGEILGNIDTREKYIEIMRKGKMGLYSTPGIDGDESRTKGYHQVTPRFLELVATGCHIIARYSMNSDTEYYDLKSFSENIETYEQFEMAVQKALDSDVDMKKYSDYLSMHYTSVRANSLKNIIDKL